MRVEIVGHNLPGRNWCAEGEALDNVHVGVQEGRDPVDLVPADAPNATWNVDIRVSAGPDGELDFKGPAVQGKRGERFVYLTWGNVGPNAQFTMFRRAKLMLGDVDPELVHGAERTQQALRATVNLTDDLGGPRCARLRPSALSWTLA